MVWFIRVSVFQKVEVQGLGAFFVFFSKAKVTNYF